MYRIDLPNSDYIDTLYDVVVIAKPKRLFEEDKYKLDQVPDVWRKDIWLIDPVIAEFDSLKHAGRVPLLLTIPRHHGPAHSKYGRGSTTTSSRTNGAAISGALRQHLPGQTLAVQPRHHRDSTSSIPSANIDAVEAKFVSSIDTTAVPGIREDHPADHFNQQPFSDESGTSSTTTSYTESVHANR